MGRRRPGSGADRRRVQRERSRAAGDDLTAPSPSPSVSTTGSPDAFDATALETATPIKHVVFLIKENRTFDNLFGTFPGANGVSTGMAFGQPRTLTRGTDGRVPGDLPPLLHVRARGVGPGRDGRVPAGRARADGPTRSSTRTSCRTTGTGRARTCCSTTSSRARRGRRSRTTCTRSRRTSGGAHDNPSPDVPSLDATARTRSAATRRRCRRSTVYDSEGRHEEGAARASTS